MRQSEAPIRSDEWARTCGLRGGKSAAIDTVVDGYSACEQRDATLECAMSRTLIHVLVDLLDLGLQIGGQQVHLGVLGELIELVVEEDDELRGLVVDDAIRFLCTKIESEPIGGPRAGRGFVPYRQAEVW